jgi:hypothetical protein
MISLHVAGWLEQEGFGILDTDIFWEDMPVDNSGKPKDGIWVVTRASSDDRFTNTQQIDIYTRYKNKLTGAQVLESILTRIKEAYGDVCTLPSVEPYSYNQYYDVIMTPVSSIDNVGTDEQGKVVRSISMEIKYKKEQ